MLSLDPKHKIINTTSIDCLLFFKALLEMPSLRKPCLIATYLSQSDVTAPLPVFSSPLVCLPWCHHSAWTVPHLCISLICYMYMSEFIRMLFDGNPTETQINQKHTQMEHIDYVTRNKEGVLASTWLDRQVTVMGALFSVSGLFQSPFPTSVSPIPLSLFVSSALLSIQRPHSFPLKNLLCVVESDHCHLQLIASLVTVHGGWISPIVSVSSLTRVFWLGPLEPHLALWPITMNGGGLMWPWLHTHPFKETVPGIHSLYSGITYD